jgi:nucleoside-diphosphate-sugar epimerase
MSKKIFITGHKGLIGSELVKYFKNKVIGFDRGDKWPTAEEMKDVDLIIHCASNCVIREVIKNPDLAKENIDLTYKVMELARQNNINKIVLFSSGRVKHKEKNPYTVSKELLELISEGYRQCYGIDYIIIRPETVWSMDEVNTRVIKTWITNICQEKPVNIYGNNKKELPPIHVKDFVKIFLSILRNFKDNQSQTFSIAGESRKVIDLISDIEKFTGKKALVNFLPEEKAQPQKCIKTTTVQSRPFSEQLKLENKNIRALLNR